MSIRIDEGSSSLATSPSTPLLARPSLVYVSDDDADRSARTREEAVSAYSDRILACGHFPGSSFGRILDGVWTPIA
jgi:hypothetical protein